MIERKLTLPLSPPISPPMTDRLTQFDQHPPRWSYIPASNYVTPPGRLLGEEGLYNAVQGSHHPYMIGRSHVHTYASSRVTSQAVAEADRTQLPVEDEEIDLSDAEPEVEPGTGTMTIAQLRAYNRRLKRFRLTHSQTRYLMSEFAKQPRPDAAHRERLSREISGFSPRQVQVWFQNRRAKLKRLSNDDRERIMSSRALPADFDMTHTLRPPFNTPRPDMSTGVQSYQRYTHADDPGLSSAPPIDTSRKIPVHGDATQEYGTLTTAPASWQSYVFTPLRPTSHEMTIDSSPSQIAPAKYQNHGRPGDLIGDATYGSQPDQSPSNPQVRDLNLPHHLTRAITEPNWTLPRSRVPVPEWSSESWTQAPFQEEPQSFSAVPFTQRPQPQRQRSETNPETRFKHVSSNSTEILSYNAEAHNQYTLYDMNGSKTMHGSPVPRQTRRSLTIPMSESGRDWSDFARGYHEGQYHQQAHGQHQSLIQFEPLVPPYTDAMGRR